MLLKETKESRAVETTRDHYLQYPWRTITRIRKSLQSCGSYMTILPQLYLTSQAQVVSQGPNGTQPERFSR